jgi:hypothetical protein
VDTPTENPTGTPTLSSPVLEEMRRRSRAIQRLLDEPEAANILEEFLITEAWLQYSIEQRARGGNWPPLTEWSKHLEEARKASPADPQRKVLFSGLFPKKGFPEWLKKNAKPLAELLLGKINDLAKVALGGGAAN